MKIAVIGIGNLGSALVERIIGAGAATEDLILVHRHAAKHDELGTRFGCRIVGSLPHIESCEALDLIVLAVKPQDADEACRDIRPFVSERTVVLSVMAGITLARLSHLVGHNKIARAMPTLGAVVSESATTFFCNETLSVQECALVEQFLSSCGRCWRVAREELIDVATAVAGSGPAYFCWMAEQIEAVAIEAGFSREEAHQIIVQTLQGTATYLKSTATPFAVLRQRVTSQGGTTHAATSLLQRHEADVVVKEAVRAALRRARELGGS
jgi:pyrroline-5-carboxylate reductase